MKYLNENGLTYFWSKIVDYTNNRFGNVDNTADSAKNVLSATKLTTARTINGVSFDGTTNIVTPSISTGGNINLHADSDSSTTSEYAMIKAGHNELKVTSSGGGSTVTKGQDKLTFNGNVVYHEGKKPTPAEIGASATGHTHDDRYYTESEVDTKLNAKANTSHGTHVTYSTTAPSANGTASAGSASTVSRSDHVHPLQTTVSGNAGTATKLQTARKINGVAFDGSADITVADSTKLPLTGGTVSGVTTFKQGTIVHSSRAGLGSYGYVHIAKITISAAYKNMPIRITIAQRGTSQIANIEVAFNNNSTADATLRYFNREGSIGAYIYKSATSVWDIYVKKTEGNDSIDVLSLDMGTYARSGMSVTWMDSWVESLPSGFIESSLRALDANLNGVAESSKKDSAGQQINTTYIKGLSVSGKTITYTKGDGTTGTITTQDTNTTYATGTATTAGLTKLYTSTGTATDGTMTQSAIKTALDGKSGTSHTHNYAGSSSAGGAATTALACTGNSATATKLQTARTINGVSFDGSANITVADGTKLPLSGGTMTGNIKYTMHSSTQTPVEIYGGDANGQGMKIGAGAATIISSGEGKDQIAPNVPATNEVMVIGSDQQIEFHTALQNGWASRKSMAMGTDGKLTNTNGFVGPLSGNATTATTLQTARTINGTSFNGSANITTANWGTARTLTIGNTGKSVNGSANVSWSLSEIGAAASSHTHNSIVSRGNVTMETGVNVRPAVSGLSMTQAYNNGYPTSYGNVISLRGGGDGQILVGWSGTSGAHAPVYVRSRRDTTDANWSGWQQLYSTAYKPTPADIGAASTSDLNSLTTKVNECFQSASDGKKSIASAITGMGQSTASDATFATMAANIKKISSDANATASQILSGKTAYVGGAKVTGTMTDRGAVTSTLNCGGSYTIPAGYHNGSGKITANSLASQTSATATAAQILSGQTAYVNGTKLTGTMTNNSGTNKSATPTTDTSNVYLTVPSNGYYSTTSKLYVTNSSLASKIGLTSAKIVSGNTILGIKGTAATSNFASGFEPSIPASQKTTFMAYKDGSYGKSLSLTYFTVSTSFVPRAIIFHTQSNDDPDYMNSANEYSGLVTDSIIYFYGGQSYNSRSAGSRTGTVTYNTQLSTSTNVAWEELQGHSRLVSWYAFG